MPPIEYNPKDNSYIDHELSINLDSTEAFEGPEKLLELWFYPSQDHVPDQSKTLRSISVNDWTKLLDLVNCKVLSIKSSSKLDAYLLSESSLFVYDHKLILKTCGTTLTLHCLSALFQLVQTQLDWKFLKDGHQPYRVFYSRRAFMFPSKQKSIHKNWTDEVEYLNQFFTNGSHYLIGRIDNSHWHLYTTELSTDAPRETENDENFEILMTEISQDRAQYFNTSRKPGFEIDEDHDLGHFLGNSTSHNTGLNDLYPTQRFDGTDSNMIHDAFSFTPCGYSSNTVLNEDSYYTLHVTPEKDWSYASFESNVNPNLFSPKINNIDILKKVLAVFKPGKFQLIFFNNFGGDNWNNLSNIYKLDNYTKVDKIIYDLGTYHLLYVSFALDEDKLIDNLKI